MWEWDGRVRLLVVIVIAALLFGAGIQYGRWQCRKAADSMPMVIKDDDVVKSETKDIIRTVTVHVAGAVEEPGVYQLPEGARVNDAVGLAGLLPESEPHALNLAAPLIDGQVIRVPAKGEESTWPVSDGGTSGSIAVSQVGAGININSASLEELNRLPGIGPVLAQRIIDYRQQHGPFRTIEDIQNVSGIGPQKYDGIKEIITVY